MCPTLHAFVDPLKNLLGYISVDVLVVVSLVVVATIDSPMVLYDMLDRLPRLSQDAQPAKHCPKAIFFPNVVASSAE
jgi:hypothetical protein